MSERADASTCVLCGFVGAAGFAASGARPACPVCGWLVGDTPDPDLPRPRVEVVYYIRWNERIKIGTSAHPAQRLAAIWHHELMAFELGGRARERLRHEQFAALREGGEWFRADPVLLAHIQAIAGDTPPWHRYARWMADALGRIVS